MKKRRPNLKGFTLIEVLLGLMIFSIISLTLYNVFWMGLKVDHRSEGINKNFQEGRLAFEVITKDLENAIMYDFSTSYPQEISFKGEENQLSLLLATHDGIKSVHFYLGMPDLGKITRVIIRQHMNNVKHLVISSTEELPIRFFMRQEASLPEYLAGDKYSTPGEIIAASIKKDSLKFQYGSLADVASQEQVSKEIIWKDSWKESTLPIAVRVEMTIFDPDNPKEGAMLKRDIYLVPIELKQSP